jgi:hypothetical protein
MAAMMVASVGTAFAKVERVDCPEGFPCRQAVLLPDEPQGKTYNGFGQASSACAALDITDERRPERSYMAGGKATLHGTAPARHCEPGEFGE